MGVHIHPSVGDGKYIPSYGDFFTSLTNKIPELVGVPGIDIAIFVNGTKAHEALGKCYLSPPPQYTPFETCPYDELIPKSLKKGIKRQLKRELGRVCKRLGLK